MNIFEIYLNKIQDLINKNNNSLNTNDVTLVGSSLI